MGNLWNKIHDFFDVEDGTYPEICVCRLTRQSICESFDFIRKHSSTVMGQNFIDIKTNEPVSLSDVANAAELVCDGLAEPFHFIVRNLQLSQRAYLMELGVFILDNAIALDFAKGPLWGEIEIAMLFKLIKNIMKNSPEAFLQLEECIANNVKQRFIEAFNDFLNEE